MVQNAPATVKSAFTETIRHQGKEVDNAGGKQEAEVKGKDRVY